MELGFEMTKRSYEIWDISTKGKNYRVLGYVLTSFGPIINHIWNKSNASIAIVASHCVLKKQIQISLA